MKISQKLARLLSTVSVMTYLYTYPKLSFPSTFYGQRIHGRDVHFGSPQEIRVTKQQESDL